MPSQFSSPDHAFGGALTPERGRGLLVAVVCMLASFAVSAAVQAAQDAHSSIVLGTIIDAATGAPLARVRVLDEASGRTVVTDAEGRFALALPGGSRVLHVSAVGFVLVRREVEVPAQGGRVAITISLTGGTGTYSEAVVVSGDVFGRDPAASPGRQLLDSADIQNLRGVLADDPLRAVQSMSGAATGDDLHSEFSVRGSSFSHLDFTVDGLAAPFLLHTVRGVEDYSSSGSVAMINSDVLQDAALDNGGYPQRDGNRTGAAVAFRLREGSRDRTELRGSISGTSMSAVGEGPLGPGRRGSWLASARYSYLDRLIDRLADDALKFGFSDAQSKLVFDLTSSQRVELTVIAGRSRLSEPAEDVASDDLFAGRNASVLTMGKWRRTSARGLITAGVLSATNRFTNDSIAEIVLDEGTDRQVTTRIDGQYQWSPALHAEAGALMDWTRATRFRQRPVFGALAVTNDFTGEATRAGGYGLVRWRPHPRLLLSPGVRVDRWSLTRDVEASPWVQAEWQVGRAVGLRGGAGIYRQAPELEQAIGAWSADAAGLERATQVDLALEWRPRPALRLQATLFDRQEADFMRRAGAETRLIDGRLVRGSLAARYANRLDGFARGVELLAQARNPNGLTGWVSYAYGRNQYHDRVSAETFWGNLDQRHTLNVYAAYRLTARTSVSAKLRTGSNFPAPGYYAESDGRFFVSDRRNEVRLPAYARLDLRANRTFSWSRRRLTLFAEVINVLNRANVRYNPPSIDSRTREARYLYESMIPIVPSAGVLIEF